MGKCNKCKKQSRECTCHDVGLESCSTEICYEKMDAHCVVYKKNQPDISNFPDSLGIDGNTPVDEILEKLARISFDMPQATDELVKVNATDFGSGYLEDKITTGDCLSTFVTSEKKLRISLDFNCLCQKLQLINCTSTNTSCVPQALKPIIDQSLSAICGLQTAVLAVSGHNGTLQWFRNNVAIEGANSTIYNVQGQGGTYFVRNTTVCNSTNSDSVSVVYSVECDCDDPVTTPIVTPSTGSVLENQTLELTANNCNGTLEWYNQSNVLVDSGSSTVVGTGTYYARCTNQCGSANSNMVVISPNVTCPTISAVLNKTNPTCTGMTLLENGVIDVLNISNGVQIAIDNNSYVPLNNLEGANTHKFTNLAAGVHIVHIKPSNSSCVATSFSITLNATTCGCAAISGSYTTTPTTCMGQTPNADGSIFFHSLINVARISIATACNANACSSAYQVPNGDTTFTINNVVAGTYCVRMYATADCYTDYSGVVVASDCCDLEITNPVISC